MPVLNEHDCERADDGRSNFSVDQAPLSWKKY